MKKKIIFSNYDDLKNPYYGGGGARAIHEVAKRLKDDFQIQVITSGFKGSKNEVIDGVAYSHIGTTLFGPQFSQLIFLFLLPFYIQTQSFDLWIENFTPPFGSAFLNLFTRKPVVALIHMLPGKDMERKYRLPFSLIQNLVVKTRKFFIVLTNSSKQEIKSINAQTNLAVIPNGVTIPKLTKNVKKTHLLFMGRTEFNQKGLDLLLDTYSRLKNPRLPDLVIAGSSTEKEKALLDAKIASLGLNDRVKQLGRVVGNSRDLAFRKAAVCICPSRFETQSLVALEAMAYGIPLACFDIAGLRWIPASCCLRAKQFNVSELARNIDKILASTALWSKLSVNGRNFALAHSWDRSALLYKKFIYQVLNYEHT